MTRATPDRANPRMDAVLPLLLRDFPRARLLFRSLARNFDGLGTLYLVTRESELAAVRKLVSELPQQFEIQVESELDVVPELSLTSPGGWYKQQLVKLAIAEHVQSELYLTFDADVVCSRPVRAAELAPAGRGLCYVIEQDLHPLWYTRSLAVLGMKAPRTGILHNVTPAVLHRRAVFELAEFLNERARDLCFARGLRGIRQAFLLARARLSKSDRYSDWRTMLAGGLPWTEYALYYSFLEATGRFEAFHVGSPTCIYDIDNSVWYDDRSGFESWDPGPSCRGGGPPWFVVVQSNTKIAPELVHSKFEPYFAGAQ